MRWRTLLLALACGCVDKTPDRPFLFPGGGPPGGVSVKDAPVSPPIDAPVSPMEIIGRVCGATLIQDVPARCMGSVAAADARVSIAGVSGAVAVDHATGGFAIASPDAAASVTLLYDPGTTLNLVRAAARVTLPADSPILWAFDRAAFASMLTQSLITWVPGLGIVFAYGVDGAGRPITGMNASGTTQSLRFDQAGSQILTVGGPSGPAGLVALINVAPGTTGFDFVPPSGRTSQHLQLDVVADTVTVAVIRFPP
jgi:hypothetical protein